MSFKKKRSLLITFTFIFLFVSIVFGEINENTQKYTSFVVGCNGCDDYFNCDNEYPPIYCGEDNDVGFYSLEIDCVWLTAGERAHIADDRGEECVEEWDLVDYRKPSGTGCWVLGGEDDGVGGEDCAAGISSVGVQVNGREGNVLMSGRSVSRLDDLDDADPSCMMSTYEWRLPDPEDYICSDDHYWHKCAVEDEFQKTNPKLFAYSRRH